jgi:hypothetical protein
MPLNYLQQWEANKKMGLSWALQVTQMPPKEDPISDPFVRSEERGDTQMSSPQGTTQLWRKKCSY